MDCQTALKAGLASSTHLRLDRGMSASGLRPEITAMLGRGVQKMLADLAMASILEMPLGNGRRADIVALGPSGTIWIVETKSGLEDFAVDQKWPDYRDYCDQFLFAVAEDFPLDLIALDCGLIVADGFGGEILRPGPEHSLSGARRKAMLLGFARLAAERLRRVVTACG
jgi:hypothetical protein